jgi:hypothetical protein
MADRETAKLWFGRVHARSPTSLITKQMSHFLAFPIRTRPLTFAPSRRNS